MIKINEIYKVIDTINTSDKMINLSVNNDGEIINIKASLEFKNVITIGKPYYLKYEQDLDSPRLTCKLIDFKPLDECSLDFFDKDRLFREFYQKSDYTLKQLTEGIYSGINDIKNDILRSITFNLIDKNKEDFFLFPAATKYHHAYVGGLAHHTLNMLNLSKSIALHYPNVNTDYLFSGIILHDIGKIKEFTKPIETNYSDDGQLLGHLVIGSQMVLQEAINLNVADSLEVKILEHIIISHHGQLAFGSAKKPMTIEAFLVNLIDSLDSKVEMVENELKKVNHLEFTEAMISMDRTRFFKHSKE